MCYLGENIQWGGGNRYEFCIWDCTMQLLFDTLDVRLFVTRGRACPTQLIFLLIFIGPKDP